MTTRCLQQRMQETPNMSARSVLELSRPVRRRLTREMRKTKDAGYRVRLSIVRLYWMGDGTSSIAVVLGCAPATAVRVLQRFRKQGLEGIRDRRCDNGSRKVDSDLLQALAELVDESPEDHGWTRPTWTLELFVEALHALTRVLVSRTTVGQMLGQLGARWGMARPTVACPWSRRRRQRRLAQIKKTLAELGPDEVAYFEDEVDIHLNPKIGRDWMHRGTQKRIPTPGQNKKAYLAGAVAADGTDFVFAEWPKKNSDLFIALLGVLHRHHPEKRVIHVVLDNYAIHSSVMVKALLANLDGRFQLHFLPPYCPDENKIERLWRDLHANVTRNHRCGTLPLLMKKARSWLRSDGNRRRALANPHLPRTLKRAA